MISSTTIHTSSTPQNEGDNLSPITIFYSDLQQQCTSFSHQYTWDLTNMKPGNNIDDPEVVIEIGANKIAINKQDHGGSRALLFILPRDIAVKREKSFTSEGQVVFQLPRREGNSTVPVTLSCNQKFFLFRIVNHEAKPIGYITRDEGSQATLTLAEPATRVKLPPNKNLNAEILLKSLHRNPLQETKHDLSTSPLKIIDGTTQFAIAKSEKQRDDSAELKLLLKIPANIRPVRARFLNELDLEIQNPPKGNQLANYLVGVGINERIYLFDTTKNGSQQLSGYIVRKDLNNKSLVTLALKPFIRMQSISNEELEKLKSGSPNS